MRFSEIIGHEKLKKRLVQSAVNDRIAHAQLFSGPEGSGHLALALAYVQFLSCENILEEDSCDNCPSCIKCKKLIHPDLHFSFPTSPLKDRKAKSDDFMSDWREAVLQNPYMSLFDWYEFIGIENKQGYMSVDESSDILRKLSLKTYEGKFKVMVIWMAEKMRVDASNKLLKMIEEPPDNTIFILVTENRDQVLSTILSRTQLVKINRFEDSEIISVLKSKNHLDQRYAQRIAHISEGNMNAALSMAKSESDSLEMEKEFMNWMRLCFSLLRKPEKDSETFSKLNEWIDTVAKSGRERQKIFLQYGLEVARQCLLNNYVGAELTRINEEVLPGFQKFSPFINANNAERFEDELSKACFHIERNANPRILFLDLSFKINALLKVAAD